MRPLIFIASLVASYLALTTFVDNYPLWLRASIAALILLATLIVFSIVGKKSYRGLRNFRKFKLTDWLIGAVAFLLIFGLTFVTFVKAPELTISAREQVVKVFSQKDATVEADENGDPVEQPRPNHVPPPKKGTQYEGPEAQLVNDERDNLRIPKRIELTETMFPQVHLIPLGDESKAGLAGKDLYLLSRTLCRFDTKTTTWRPEESQLKFRRADKSGWVQFDEPAKEGAIRYRIEQAAGQKLLLGLQGLNRVKLPFVKSLGDGKFILPPTDLEENLVYEAVSTPKNLKELPAASTNSLSVAEADRRFTELALQAPLSNHIDKIAFEISKHVGTHRRLLALRKYFNDHCSYSLSVKNPGNHDPISNFLAYEKKGFCVHYSTATALVCRRLGIPSRVAVGFLGGKYFEDENVYEFYTKNLHAWVEVKLEGYGWVTFDTSPSVLQQSEQAEEGESPRDIQSREEIQQEMEHLANQEFLDSFDMQAIVTETKWIMIVIGALLMVLMTCLGLQKKQRNKRRGSEEDQDQRTHYEEAAYLALFRKVCQLNSVPMAYGDTLKAHIAWLEERAQSPAFSNELLRYHYDTTYRESDVSKKIEFSLIKEMKRWKI